MEDFYVYGVNEKNGFKTKDGKFIVPVLMVNAAIDSPALATDWATTYLLADQVDTTSVYHPQFVQQKDGSYKRKFRKES